MKFDKGKLMAGILFQDFPNAIEGMLKVATFGAGKYKRSSWQTVPNALERYEDALYRHLLSLAKGEEIDPESGLPHIDHAVWNVLAISEFHKESKKENG